MWFWAYISLIPLNPLAYVAYSRRAASYSRTRLSQLYLNYRPMMRVVDGLAALDYVENHIGFLDRSRNVGIQSRMRATPKLIDLIQGHEVTPPMIDRGEGEVIVLRDSEDVKISYEDTDEIERMRKELRSYNTYLQGHQLGLSLPVAEIRKIL